MNGWEVFNSSTTTNNLITYTGTTTAASGAYTPTVWTYTDSPPELSARRKDPLDWLRGEVNRYVELGTLHD